MRSRPFAVVLAVAAFAGAAAATVLAADVLRYRSHLEATDVRFEAMRGERRMYEDAPAIVPGGVARNLLGVEDDVQLREAVQAFRLAGFRSETPRQDQVALKSAAELGLERAGRAVESDRIRSYAANLRGVIAFEGARTSVGDPALFLRRALAEFREAVRLDGSNEHALYNLELVLRLLLQTDPGGDGGTSGARADTPASGAGSATSGSGY